MYTGNYSVYRCSLGILGGNGLIYFMMSYFHWGFEFMDWSKLSYGWLHGMPFTYIWIKFHYYVSNCEHSKIKIPEIYPHLQYYSISKKEEIISGGSKNFKIGGRGGLYPGTLEILGSGDSFDTPSMICPVFSSESRE